MTSPNELVTKIVYCEYRRYRYISLYIFIKITS